MLLTHNGIPQAHIMIQNNFRLFPLHDLYLGQAQVCY